MTDFKKTSYFTRIISDEISDIKPNYYEDKTDDLVPVLSHDDVFLSEIENLRAENKHLSEDLFLARTRIVELEKKYVYPFFKQQGKGRKSIDIDLNFVATLRRSGMTLEKVADKLNISVRTLERRLKALVSEENEKEE